MAGCIGDVDLDLAGRNFVGPAGKEEQSSANDDEDEVQENYGSRHRAFRSVSMNSALLPDLRPRCIAPDECKILVPASIGQLCS